MNAEDKQHELYRQFNIGDGCRELIEGALHLSLRRNNNSDQELSGLDILYSALRIGERVSEASKRKIGGRHAALGYLYRVISILSADTYKKFRLEYGNWENYEALFSEVHPTLDPDTRLPEEIFDYFYRAQELVRTDLGKGAKDNGDTLGAMPISSEMLVAAIIRKIWKSRSSDSSENSALVSLITRSGLSEVEWLLPVLGPHSPTLISYQRDLCLWLCQYRSNKMADLDKLEIPPEGPQVWRINGVSLRSKALARKEQSIVFWRTVDNPYPDWREHNRGGVVGWGRIHDPATRTIEKEQLITLLIKDWYPNDILSGRDEVLRKLQPKGEWPGQVSMLELDPVEIIYFTRLRHAESQDNSIRPPDLISKLSVDHEIVDDRAETDVDLLARAPLAYGLSYHLNRMMDQQAARGKGNPSDEADASFTLHINAPWGGGKTTFSNLVAGILSASPQSPGLKTGKGLRRWWGRWTGTAMPSDPEKPSFLQTLDLDNTANWPRRYLERDWLIVKFNAWRHEHVLPPWWNLYQVFRRECVQSLSTGGQIRHWIGERWWRIFSPEFRRALFAVAFIVSVVSLLCWFFPQFYSWITTTAKNDNKELAGNIAPTLAILTLLGGSGIALVRSAQSGVRSLINSSTESVNAAALGEDDPLNRFRKRFRQLAEKFDRPVLVVIDDLDRCKPKYVVELIRGLLTIFQARGVVFALLGDRKWIDSSFAIEHKSMQDLSGEEPADFGKRFAEKAIQLSLLLPHIGNDARLNYVSAILLGAHDGNAPLKDSARNEEIENYVNDMKEQFRATKNRDDRAAAYEQAKKQAEKTFEADKSNLQTAIQYLNRESALTSIRSDRIEQEIQHALLDAIDLLPNNPRRIKRLINMIALYQMSAQVMFGTVEGSNEWHELVLWIILMSEHRDSWKALVNNPELTEIAVQRAGQVDETHEPHPVPWLNDTQSLNVISGAGYKRKGIRLSEDTVRKFRYLTPEGSL